MCFVVDMLLLLYEIIGKIRAMLLHELVFFIGGLYTKPMNVDPPPGELS